MPKAKKNQVTTPPAGGGVAAPEGAGSVPAQQNIDVIETEFDTVLRSLTVKLASELPDAFTGWVNDVRTSQNRFGNTVIKIRINMDDGQTVISYPKTTWPQLFGILKELGFRKLSDIIGVTFKWERRYAGKTRYPRHFPVEVRDNEQ